MSLFAFGSNRFGQLGTGATEDATLPLPIDALKGTTLRDIRCGEQFSMALTSLGDVFTWGRGREGQLGHDHRRDTPVPRKVDALAHEAVDQIAAGWQHALALTSTKRVFQWGSLHTLDAGSDRSQVPTFGSAIRMPGMHQRRIIEESSLNYFSGGDQEAEAAVRELNFGAFRAKIEPAPVLVGFFDNSADDRSVVHLCAGYAFSVAITADGSCYTWGFNEVGQLGHGHRFNSHEPIKVAGLADEKVVDAACGQQHVVVLCASGLVYTWGLGVFGQLGHGSLHNERRPRLLESMHESAMGVQCGAHFSVILRRNAAPLVFGHAEYGQHGGLKNHEDWHGGVEEEDVVYGGTQRARDAHSHAVPRSPAVFKGTSVDAIACGSLHNVAVVRTKGEPSKVLTWGWGSSGALGHGDRRFQLVPRAVFGLAGITPSRVAAGDKHTLVVAATSSFAVDYKPAIHNFDNSCDLAFVFDGSNRRLYGHRTVLATRLPGFDRMLLFQERFTNARAEPDGATTVIPMGRTQFQVMRALLTYAYTDLLECPPHLFGGLARLAFVVGAPHLAAQAWGRAVLAGFSQTRYECLQKDVIAPARLVEARQAERRLAQEPSTLVRDLDHVFEHGRHDVVLVQGEQRIGAHRFVLVSRCAYFRKLLAGNFREANASELHLDGLDPDILIAVLRFIYTNELTIEADNVVSILEASDRLLLEPLKQRAERFLLDNALCDVDDVTTADPELLAETDYLLGVAEQFGAPKLKRACEELQQVIKDQRPELSSL